ncbi:MAG: DM13 domain-containing protein [Ferruginibacter sp.]
MKQCLSIIVLFPIFFCSCKKENNTPNTPVIEIVDTSATLKLSGIFSNGPYGSVSGMAKVYLKDGKFTLVLDGVTISNGPDLHVYLSKEISPVNFIDLGKLKSTGGTQVYDIAGSPNFSQYKYALVHCQLFDHLFGSSQLL